MGGNNAGTRLKFYYLGSWYEVSSGFPPIVGSAQRVARVRVHPVYQNVVYAVMNGVDFYAEGQKVFKSTDRGFTWENITGNMPNIPLRDIAMDPGNDNNLYLASEMGCFRTSNGGATWVRWNNGMPQANIVTELRTTYIGGMLNVIAATYGRSAWIRDATTSDPGKFALYHGALKIPVVGTQHSQDTIGVKNGDVNGFVAGLTVRIDTLIHPSVGELIITLRHGGIDDTLYNRTAPPGVPGSNFLGTQFDDTAPTTISLGTPPFAGTYQPAQPLAQFNNLDPVGPWILDVFQAAGSDTGTLEGWTLSIQPETPTGVTAEREKPTEFSIGQNYPNPFNPSTNISYQIPKAVQVKVTVFDIVGRSVAVLVDGWEQPGTYSVRFDGSRLASGVYLYRLEAGTYAQTRKLVLLK
jgi:hypothetical protein